MLCAGFISSSFLPAATFTTVKRCWTDVVSWQLQLCKAQYTPPTRRNFRVESRRRCVRNSQLVGDSFDKSEQICKQQVELRRVGGVNAPVGSRRELAANCVHTADADATQLDSCVASASAVCMGITPYQTLLFTLYTS